MPVKAKGPWSQHILAMSAFRTAEACVLELLARTRNQYLCSFQRESATPLPRSSMRQKPIELLLALLLAERM